MKKVSKLERYLRDVSSDFDKAISLYHKIELKYFIMRLLHSR